MRFHRIISAALAEPWAILPSKLKEIEALLADKAAGVVYSKEEIEARIGGAKATAIAKRPGAVAVIPIVGTIAHRASGMEEASGITSTTRIASWFRDAMGDEGVKAIILDIDSPGGGVSGVEELATEIHAARGGKPIIAVASSMAASAAYWLAAQADEVVVTPSGAVGSIGVYMAHIDMAGAMEQAGYKATLISAGQHKTEGHPYGPLDDEARADMQAKVDGFYKMFTGAVQRGRGKLDTSVMQGRMYLAAEAVKVGLADRVATLDETISRFAGAPASRSGARADDGTLERMRMELDLLQ